MNNSNPNRICVGAVVGAFGVKGELRIKSFCADPIDINRYNPLFSEDGKTEYSLKIIGPIKGGFSARIKDVRYRDQAEALKGVTLHADRSLLPNLPDDEFYHSDLVGLEVFDTGGELMGRIIAVYDHGAGDILEIKGKGMKSAALLPFTKEAVPTIDLTTQRIIIDPPIGVFS